MARLIEQSIPIISTVRNKLAEAFFSSGLYIFSGTFFAVVLQGLLYLKRGEWPNWVLIDLIGAILPDRLIKWLFSPQDWLGLHKIIMSMLFDMPITVYGMALGLICLWASNMAEEN